MNLESSRNIWHVTLLLAAIAGFCDTVTFVSADSIFSAHVTGNFIVFAYQIIKGSDVNAWVKLLTFPVFIISVMVGGQIASRSASKYQLFIWEGIILSLCGLITIGLNQLSLASIWTVYLMAMMVVFALGLQNAFGRLFSKETFGPTTVMTGNVTQASLDLRTLMKTGLKNEEVKTSFKKQLVTIASFLLGCFLGALAGKYVGLETLLIPGIAMLICYYINREHKSITIT